MSDAREAVNEAIRQQRLLAAKTTVREDELSREITSLTAERSALGDANEALRAALGEKLALLEAERTELRSQRGAALAEIAKLGKLAGQIPVNEAKALAREALAFTGAEEPTPPPPRLSEEEARAQLAALRAQRAASPPPPPADPTADDAPPPPPPPSKRTL
jgi:chromosome segregation ATPase